MSPLDISNVVLLWYWKAIDMVNNITTAIDDLWHMGDKISSMFTNGCFCGQDSACETTPAQ